MEVVYTVEVVIGGDGGEAGVDVAAPPLVALSVSVAVTGQMVV